jgi:prevent-host-death family protein
MKTISLRELHNKTGQWMRSVSQEEEIVVTDRGTAIASIVPYRKRPAKKKTWANRSLLPGFAAYLRDGKMGTDSTPGISADRSSRDNSIAGFGD